MSSPKKSDEEFHDAVAEPAPAAPAELPPEGTKPGVRVRMWNKLDEGGFVNFPTPCKNRMPNFKDAEVAADKLKAQEWFKKAKTVKVNPDKPQQQVRFNVMDDGKRLLIPTPRLRSGLFNVVTPPE